jgi:iron complex transport system ATP-binding protein
LHEGRLVAYRPPGEIITESLVEQVLRLRCRVVLDPVSGTPMVLPIGRHNNVSIEASDRVSVHRASRW